MHSEALLASECKHNKSVPKLAQNTSAQCNKGLGSPELKIKSATTAKNCPDERLFDSLLISR